MNQFWQTMIASGAVGTLITGIFAWLQHRAGKKQEAVSKRMDADGEMRKELWQEINNLRQALREASNTLMEWQSRVLTLIGSVQSNAEQLRKIGTLLNNALACLDRVEEVERLILNENDLIRAQAELASMKADAALLRARASVIYDITS